MKLREGSFTALHSTAQELFLDSSVQENLLENARVGITTLHQCDFSIDITEDNVMVTGFTVEYAVEHFCVRKHTNKSKCPFVSQLVSQLSKCNKAPGKAQ